MKEKLFNVLILWIAVGLFFFGLVGFSNRNHHLYEDMVNASVLIRAGSGFGSGVFIDDNVILTAAHCLRGRGTQRIELSDGTILESDDFYIDDIEDVGFIFVVANELFIANISKDLGNIGDTVFLVGTPQEPFLKFTLSKGILSHLDRDIFDWKDLIQTDAASAPGSSGGPMYDERGNLIGIVVGSPPRGGVTVCESAKSILEAYQRCKDATNIERE